MAYTYPEDYLAWYISGDKIALVTKKNTSSKNIYESIDESQDDGMLIVYSAEPQKVENISDVPDCDNTLHTAIVNYLKWKLYEDGNDEGSILGRGDLEASGLEPLRNTPQGIKWVVRDK